MLSNVISTRRALLNPPLRGFVAGLVAAFVMAQSISASTVEISRPLPCSFFAVPHDTIVVNARVSLGSFTIADYTKSDQSHSQKLVVHIDGPTTAAYDFDVPPTHHFRGRTWEFCPKEEQEASSLSWFYCANGKPILTTKSNISNKNPKVKVKGSSLELTLPFALETGFYKLTARIDDVWQHPGGTFPTTSLGGIHQVFFAVHGDDAHGNDIMVNAYHNSINKTLEKTEMERVQLENLNVRAGYFQLKYRHKRIHPEIFSFSPDFVDTSLREAIEQEDPQLLAAVVEPLSQHGIYKFKLFTDDMRSKLRRELQFFGAESMKWPRKPSRPNSMNDYGIMLNEVGLSSPMIDDLARQYLFKMAMMLLPDWAGDHMSFQHSFLVKYSSNEDVSLDKHMDQSAITVNVCLGDDYKGGELLFQGQRGHESEGQNFTIRLEPGEAVMHAGQHWHRVLPVTSGEKQNVVIWMRSSHLRDSSAEKFGVACPNLHARSNIAEELTQSQSSRKEKGARTKDVKDAGSKSGSRSSKDANISSRVKGSESSTKSKKPHEKNVKGVKTTQGSRQKRNKTPRAERSSSRSEPTPRQDEL